MKHDALVSEILGTTQSPVRLAITGWPAVGKTTTSSAIAKVVVAALRIEAESWIWPVQYRDANGWSGSDPRSYDVGRALKDLADLVCGKTVGLGQYSHASGRIVSEQRIRHPLNCPYVLDGTLFSLEAFSHLIDTCIFIRPKDSAQWLDVAIQRDVEQRYFRPEDALEKNRAKLRDMLQLERTARHAVFVEWSLDARGEFDYRPA